MKNKILYEINETTLEINEDRIKSFGIRCRKGEEVLASVEDISPDKESVEKLAKLCNSLSLDPHQLKEVAEDWITD